MYTIDQETIQEHLRELVPTKPCTGKWYFENSVTGEKLPFRCKSGRCERQECRDFFCRKRVATICNVLPKYGLTKFFTLTLDRSMPVWQAWDDISYLWAKMRRRLYREAKKAGIELKFVAVLEQHKDGYPHIHGFTNLWLHKSLWSMHWYEVGGGKNGSRIEGVKDLTNCGEYVTKELNVAKYVGKDNVVGALQHVKKGKRTFWRSKGLKTDYELKPKVESEWKLVKGKNHEAYERKNLERALQAIPGESIESSITKLEASETPSIGVEKGQRPSTEAREDKRRDKELKEFLEVKKWCESPLWYRIKWASTVFGEERESDVWQHEKKELKASPLCTVKQTEFFQLYLFELDKP